MIDLGMVVPGSTIRIPFSSFDKDDGSSITMTNYAAADILVYKDGSTTERASTAGFTATTDFDTKTGKHLAIIDLADNTTAGFFAAGSEYLVAIDAVTVDAVTTGGWIARFMIGYRSATLNTTIATLASQTSFTLTAGPAEDDALNGRWVQFHDVASAVQTAHGLILDYTGATKTVTLAAAPTFTIAASDNVSVMDLAPLQPATIGRALVVDAAGLADANTVKLGPTGSGTAQTARDIGTSVLLSSGTGTGQVKLSGGYVAPNWGDVGNQTTAVALTGTTIKTATDVETDTQDIQSRIPAALTAGGNIKADALALSGDTTAADNAESFFDGTGYAGTGNVIPTVTTAGTVTTVSDKTGYALTSAYDFAKGTVAVTESYNTDGAAPTPVQALLGIFQMLCEASVSGTTLTVKKLDGSTVAMTFTLNDATAPTSVTRAS